MCIYCTFDWLIGWFLYCQGVHGAYSESAAEKAYPNCQAVPCEQFETAFEVKNKYSNPLL